MSISPNDCVARFIKTNSNCRNGRIRHGVFTPKNEETEISVFAISGLEENQVWELGHRELKTCIVGRADLTVSDICEKGFNVERKDLSSRHACIIPIPRLPFPDNSSDPRNSTAKKMRRDIAVKLIAISRFHKRL